MKHIVNRLHYFLFGLHTTGYTIPKGGSWNERKNKLREKYPILTEEDLILHEGNRNEMFGNLKTKLDKTEQELHDIIISL